MQRCSNKTFVTFFNDRRNRLCLRNDNLRNFQRLSLLSINILDLLLIFISLRFIDGNDLISLSLNVIDFYVLGFENLFFFKFNPLFSLSKVCSHMFSLDLELPFGLFFLLFEDSSLFLLNNFEIMNLIFIFLVKRRSLFLDLSSEISCLFLVLSL